MAKLTREITRRKRREASLRQSEAMAWTLLNIPSAAIMLLDTKANLIEVNETMVRRFCRTKKEMKGMCLWDILPPQVIELRKRFFEQAVSTGKVVRWEDERQGMWGDNSCIPVFDERGKVVQIIGFAVDITDKKMSEMLLKTSEERYRSLIECLPEAIITTDSMRRIISWNKAAEDMFGYKAQEIVGKDLHFVMSKQFRGMHRNKYQNRVNSKKNIESDRCREGVARRKDGTAFLIEHNACSYMSDGEEVFTAAVRDITRRKQNEDLLRESEERYRTIFESSSAGILVAQVESLRLKYANPAICSMLGYTCRELQRKGVPDIHPQESLEEVKEHFNEIALGLKSTADAVPCQHKDGSVIYADISATKMVIDGQECILGFFIDITERRSIEQRLRESEEKYRSIAETATDAIITINRKGKIVFWNSAAQAVFGYTEDEAIGRPFEIILLERSQKLIKKSLEDTYSTENFDFSKGSMKGSGRRKDGTEVPLEVSISFWKSANEYFSTCIVRDISERTRVDEQLEIQTHNLQESNAALKVLLERRDADKAELEQKMLSNIKNLLTPYVDKLKIGKLDERQRMLVSIIEVSLSEIIAPFSHKLVSKFYNLTPSEIQVAGLVRDGRNSKEIAEIMNSSARAVDFHRTSIRKKLGLKHQQANLRSYLLNNF